MTSEEFKEEGTSIPGPYSGQFGCFTDITRETYQLKMNQISQSWLSYFDVKPKAQKTPANFAYDYLSGEERKKTDALRFGDAFHTRILEPEEFKRRVVWWEQTKTTNSKGYEKAEAELQLGQMLLPTAWKDTLDGMFEAIARNKDIMDLLEMPGDNECTLLWKDQHTGVECKSRLDRCVKDFGLIIDLKTTRDASEEGFSKSVRDYDYHVQDFAYRKGYEEVFKQPAKEFAFIVCEKEPPFLNGIYYLEKEAIEVGEYLFNNRIERFSECWKRQYWPGYQEKPTRLSLPSWYYNKIENGEI